MRGSRLLIVLATAALVGALPAAALAGAPGGSGGSGTPAPGGTIVFQRISDPATTFTVSPDGSNLRDVGCAGDRTKGGVPRRNLRVEPTGVTFAAYVDGLGLVSRNVVRIVSRDEACGDAAVLAELPAGLDVTGATWSLDGRRVALGVLRFDATGQLIDQGIWVGEVSGTGSTATLAGLHLAVALPMTPVAGQAAGPLVAYYALAGPVRWSSDGRRAVFAHVTHPEVSPYDTGIFVVDLGLPGDTTVLTESAVAVPGGSARQPVFSPVAGDARIAFVQTTGTRSCFRSDLFVTTPAGGTPVRITGGLCQLAEPDWSPDGQWFTYSAWSGALADQQSIWRVRADGSGKPVQVAADRSAILRLPVWVR